MITTSTKRLITLASLEPQTLSSGDTNGIVFETIFDDVPLSYKSNCWRMGQRDIVVQKEGTFEISFTITAGQRGGRCAVYSFAGYPRGLLTFDQYGRPIQTWVDVPSRSTRTCTFSFSAKKDILIQLGVIHISERQGNDTPFHEMDVLGAIFSISFQ